MNTPPGAERFGVTGPSLSRAAVVLLARYSVAIQIAVDSLAWALCLTVALAVRYDLAVRPAAWHDLSLFLPAVLVIQVLVGYSCGLYRGRWRIGCFDEVASLAWAAALTTVIVSAANVAIADIASSERLVPMSVPLAGGATALVGTAGARYVWRLLLDQRRRPKGEHTVRLLVFGAGDGGAQVISAMLGDPLSHYLPVALLDDNPRNRSLRIMRVRVMGGRGDIARVAAQVHAETLLIAIPTADAELVRELTELAEAAGLGVKVLPTVSQLLGEPVGLGDIRTPTMADLLGRREIDTDLGSIAGYLTNKRVLVTGAGGSIGSELCRQVYRFAPAALIMLDRDESALHAVQLSIHGRAMLDTPDVVVADIRDAARLLAVFEQWQPEVVFHAAALKHLPLCEAHPCEAVKTNIWGTQQLLETAEATGVDRFVNISTDKAADPTSVLGYTKRIAERLTAHAADRGAGTFLSVRFGNVLGSRGSVLMTFQAQVDAGGPVTVTHPDVTRYFMTVEEAVQLTIQAGAIGNNGEVLVLDMGEPVRIADVAHQLVAQSERKIDVIYTGLRPGEKLHEVLWGGLEHDRRQVHDLICQVRVPPIDPAAVWDLGTTATAASLILDLRDASVGMAELSSTTYRRLNQRLPVESTE